MKKTPNIPRYKKNQKGRSNYTLRPLPGRDKSISGTPGPQLAELQKSISKKKTDDENRNVVAPKPTKSDFNDDQNKGSNTTHRNVKNSI